MSSRSDPLTVDGSAELEKLLDSRWSCRAYETRQVPRADIERLFAPAQWSASLSAIQIWVIPPTATARRAPR